LLLMSSILPIVLHWHFGKSHMVGVIANMHTGNWVKGEDCWPHLG